MFLACNAKKHQAAVQWIFSAFQWSVNSWAFSNPNDDVCVARFVPNVTTLGLAESQYMSLAHALNPSMF